MKSDRKNNWRSLRFRTTRSLEDSNIYLCVDPLVANTTFWRSHRDRFSQVDFSISNGFLNNSTNWTFHLWERELGAKWGRVLGFSCRLRWNKKLSKLFDSLIDPIDPECRNWLKVEREVHLSVGLSSDLNSASVEGTKLWLRWADHLQVRNWSEGSNLDPG